MTLVIAHRGAGPAGPEPENTLAAFEAAVDLGADGVELDVRQSADGHLVVHHDPGLESGQAISDLPAGRLPSSIPSLGEALDACGSVIVNIELKSSPLEPGFDPQEPVAAETARLLNRRVAEDKSNPGSLVVSSFSLPAMAAFSAEAPAIETAWLAGIESAGTDLVATCQKAGMDGLHPSNWLVDENLVEAAQAAGLAVRVWTVNDHDRLVQLGGFGVEAVITNEVLVARQALG